MVKRKANRSLKLASEWTIFWLLGGFVVAYFAYIPVTGDEVHYWHWLVALGGGVLGYGFEVLFNNVILRLVRITGRHARPGKN